MTALVRSTLRPLISGTKSAHPGLLIQRGWTDYIETNAENAGVGGKTEHIQRICDISSPDIYQRAYHRWLKITNNDTRFCRLAMKIEGRLLIGLTGGGALETGCAVSHTYGVPYIPGSSVKGIARAYAETRLQHRQELLHELFGSEPANSEEPGLSGVLVFHDAWWIPDSAPGAEKNKPFTQDVVTPHHPKYYGSEGETAATDLDSPVPNAMIGVHGSFLFTFEGPPEWIKLAKSLTEKALLDGGIGAKTAAGYGYMTVNSAAIDRIKRFVETTLPPRDRLMAEVMRLTEKQIAERFGPDINGTRLAYPQDFELLVSLVKEHFGTEISQWASETKKSNKARYKAYKFFSGAADMEN